MRRILVVMLALLVAMSTINFATGVASPKFRVVLPKVIQEMKAGVADRYSVRIHNTGSYPAYNFTVEIAGEHPFRREVSNLTQDVKYVGQNSEMGLLFDVEVSPLAAPKTYEFDIVFTYRDENNEIKTNTEKAYLKVLNDNSEPIVSVLSYNTNVPKTEKESVNSLNLNISNSGKLSAQQLKVIVSGWSTTGVILHNDVDTKTVSRLAGGEQTFLYYLIKAGPDAKPGTQQLTVSIEYKDELGNVYKREQQVAVEIGGKEEGQNTKSLVTITDIKAPARVNPQEQFELSFKLKNESEKDIENLTLITTYTEDAFLAVENSRMAVAKLKKGEEVAYKVKLRAKKDVKMETYHFFVAATIPDTGDNVITLDKKFTSIFLNVPEKDKEEETLNKPKLIITHYEYGGKVLAGEEFDLVMDVKNTSTVQATKNIKIVTTSSDNVFIPVNSSNSTYVDYIGPGETKRISVRLKSKADAAVQIYPVQVKMDYEDGQGRAQDSKNNPFSETETLSLSVYQTPVITPGDPVMDSSFYEGGKVNIDIEFYNEGRTKVTNLKVRVEGVEAREMSYYVGNFEPGQRDTFSVQGTAGAEGEYEGKFIFEFQDLNGETFSKEVDFTYFVGPAQDGANNGDGGNMGGIGDGDIVLPVPGEEEQGVNWQLYIGIGVGILALAAIAVVIIRKRRRRNQVLRNLEEDLDE